MRITYNNLEQPANLITFTDIPNILKVEDDGGGTYASMSITFGGNLSEATTGNNQWYISIMGDSISNVITSSNAINRNFYISSSNATTAAYVARALRNCPTVATSFKITHSEATVTLLARKPGVVFGLTSTYYNTNIDSTYLNTTATDGSSSSSLAGSKIDVDIYQNGNYVTTLEKNYYGSEAAFNLSPVLTTLAEYGNAIPYTINLSSLSNGSFTSLGTIDTNYISIGYMVNQGSKYLFNDSMNVAQNYSRGSNRDAANNSILYVYAPSIPISFYNGNSGGMTIQIDYLDSAYNTISSTTTSWRNSDATKKLWDLTISLDGTTFNQAFYIDVTLGAIKIRYNVIKPIKATEHYQRLYWRNSYGGISFFDFTGAKTESRDLEIETYQKNIFGYYTDPLNELEKVYDNEVKYSVTLKSHLFENDGKYIFNDLLQSAEVWTTRNGQNYAVIIDSVSVDETDNNNIYEATVKFHYSQEPSLI